MGSKSAPSLPIPKSPEGKLAPVSLQQVGYEKSKDPSTVKDAKSNAGGRPGRRQPQSSVSISAEVSVLRSSVDLPPLVNTLIHALLDIVSIDTHLQIGWSYQPRWE